MGWNIRLKKNLLHCLKYFAAQSVNKELFPIFFFKKIQKLMSGGGEGGRGEKMSVRVAFIRDVRVHDLWKRRLKLG